MGSFPESFASRAMKVFGFRPWVRRAGLSIVLVAAVMTALLFGGSWLHPALRFGWAREPFAWAYVGALWLGGAKVFAGTLRPIAEIDEERVVLRPLHQLRATSLRWESILGTEQMVGGDRLIVYYRTPKGMRFVAVNLNLVKGRRDFLALLDERLLALGFRERVVDRSRYLSKTGDSGLGIRDS
jgi:hypothetical protein